MTKGWTGHEFLSELQGHLPSSLQFWQNSLLCNSKNSWQLVSSRLRGVSLWSADSLFFFPFIFISWRLITLQYCSGFCHTLTWISHGCTWVPHPERHSHLPPHPIPQGHPSALALSTLSIEPGLVICFTYDTIHVSMLFSQIIPPSPFSHRVQKTVLYICVSFAVSHVGPSLPSF